MGNKKVIKSEAKHGDFSYWIDIEMWKQISKWEAIQKEIFYSTLSGRKLTTDEEKSICAKHGIEWIGPTQSKIGKYIMTDVGMLWEQEGFVYELGDGYEPKNEPYTGEYVITRKVSSFDF